MLSEHFTDEDFPPRDTIDIMVQPFKKDPPSNSPLGTNSFVAPTLDIPSIKGTYHCKYDSGAELSPYCKDVCLCIVFESGLQEALKIQKGESEYNTALDKFRSRWSDDQRERIPVGSEEMTNLLKLQLLDDMFDTFSPKHLATEEALQKEIFEHKLPVRIRKEFPGKSGRMADMLLRSRIGLATFDGENQQDTLVFTNDLKDLQTICLTRWFDVSSNIKGNVFERVRFDRLSAAEIESFRIRFINDPPESSRLGFQTFVEPTLNIPTMRQAYNDEFTEEQKNICLSLVFQSAVNARKTLAGNHQYKKALRSFRSRWSKDQRGMILSASEGMTELLNLQTLLDLSDTFDLKHLGTRDRETYMDTGTKIRTPVGIRDQFSPKSMIMAESIVFCKIALAMFTDEELDAHVWSKVNKSRFDEMKHKNKDLTLRRWVTTSLQSSQTIRSTRWSEVSNHPGALRNLFEQAAGRGSVRTQKV